MMRGGCKLHTFLCFLLLFGDFAPVSARHVPETKLAGVKSHHVHLHENSNGSDSKIANKTTLEMRRSRDYLSPSTGRSDEDLNVDGNKHAHETLRTTRKEDGLGLESEGANAKLRDQPVKSVRVQASAYSYSSIAREAHMDRLLKGKTGFFKYKNNRFEPNNKSLQLRLRIPRIMLSVSFRGRNQPSSWMRETATRENTFEKTRAQTWVIMSHYPLLDRLQLQRLLIPLHHDSILMATHKRWRKTIAGHMKKKLLGYLLRQRQRLVQQRAKLEAEKQRLMNQQAINNPGTKQVQIRTRNPSLMPGMLKKKRGHFLIFAFSKKKHPSHKKGKLIFKLLYPLHLEFISVPPDSLQFRKLSPMKYRNHKLVPWIMYGRHQSTSSQQRQPRTEKETQLRGRKLSRGINRSDRMDKHRQKLLMFLENSRYLRERMLLQRLVVQKWKTLILKNILVHQTQRSRFRKIWLRLRTNEHPMGDSQRHFPNTWQRPREIQRQVAGKKPSKSEGMSHSTRNEPRQVEEHQLRKTKRPEDWLVSQAGGIRDDVQAVHKLLGLANQTMQSRIEAQEKLVQELRSTLQNLQHQNSWLKSVVMDKFTKMYDLLKSLPRSLLLTGLPSLPVSTVEGNFSHESETGNMSAGAKDSRYIAFKTVQVIFRRSLAYTLTVHDNVKQVFRNVWGAVRSLLRTAVSRVSQLYSLLTARLSWTAESNRPLPATKQGQWHRPIENKTERNVQAGTTPKEISTKTSRNASEISASSGHLSEITINIANISDKEITHPGSILSSNIPVLSQNPVPEATVWEGPPRNDLMKKKEKAIHYDYKDIKSARKQFAQIFARLLLKKAVKTLILHFRNGSGNSTNPSQAQTADMGRQSKPRESRVTSVITLGNDTVSDVLVNKSSQLNHPKQNDTTDHLVLLLNTTSKVKMRGTKGIMMPDVRWKRLLLWNSRNLTRSLLWLSQLPHRLMAFIRRLELANLALRMRVLSQFFARFDPEKTKKAGSDVTERERGVDNEKNVHKLMRGRVFHWRLKESHSTKDQRQQRKNAFKTFEPPVFPETTSFTQDNSDTGAKMQERNSSGNLSARPPLVKAMGIDMDEKQTRYNHSVRRNSSSHPNVTFVVMKSTSNAKSLKYESEHRPMRKLLSLEISQAVKKPTAKAIRKRKASRGNDSLSSELESHENSVKNNFIGQRDRDYRLKNATEQNVYHSAFGKHIVHRHLPNHRDTDTGQFAHPERWLPKRQYESRRYLNPAFLRRLMLANGEPRPGRADLSTDTSQRAAGHEEKAEDELADLENVKLSDMSAHALRLKLLNFLRLLREHHVYQRYGLGDQRSPDTDSVIKEPADNGKTEMRRPKLERVSSEHTDLSLTAAITNPNATLQTQVFRNNHGGQISTQAVLEKVVNDWKERGGISPLPVHTGHDLQPNGNPVDNEERMARPLDFDPGAVDFDDYPDDTAHTDAVTHELHSVHPTRDDLEVLKNIEMLTYKAIGKANEIRRGLNLHETDIDNHAEVSSSGRQTDSPPDNRAQGDGQSVNALHLSLTHTGPEAVEEDHRQGREKRQIEFHDHDDGIPEPQDDNYLVKKDLMRDLRQKWVGMKKKIKSLQSQIYEAMDGYSDAENDLERLLRRGDALSAADVVITTDNRVQNTMSQADWKLAKAEYKKFRKAVERDQKKNWLLNKKAAKKNIHKKLQELTLDFESQRRKIDHEVNSLFDSTLSLPVRAPGSLGLSEQHSVENQPSAASDAEDNNSDMWDYLDEDGVAHFMNEIDAMNGYSTDLDNDPDLSRVDQMLSKVILRHSRDIKGFKKVGHRMNHSQMETNNSYPPISGTKKQVILQRLHALTEPPKGKIVNDSLIPVLNESSTTSRALEHSSRGRMTRALKLDQDGEVMDDSRFDISFATKWHDLKKVVKVLKKNIAEIIRQYSKAEQKVEKLIKSTARVDDNLHKLTNANAVNSTINSLKREAVTRDLNMFRNEIRQLEAMIRQNEITGMSQNLKEQIKKIATIMADQQIVMNVIQNHKTDPNLLFTFSMGTRDDLASLDYFDAIKGDPRAKVVESTAFHRLWHDPQDYDEDSTAALDEQLADLNKYEEQVNSVSDLRAIDDLLRQMLQKTAMGPSNTQELTRVKRSAENPGKSPRDVLIENRAKTAPNSAYRKAKADDEDHDIKDEDVAVTLLPEMMNGVSESDIILARGDSEGESLENESMDNTTNMRDSESQHNQAGDFETTTAPPDSEYNRDRLEFADHESMTDGPAENRDSSKLEIGDMKMPANLNSERRGHIIRKGRASLRAIDKQMKQKLKSFKKRQPEFHNLGEDSPDVDDNGQNLRDQKNWQHYATANGRPGHEFRDKGNLNQEFSENSFKEDFGDNKNLRPRFENKGNQQQELKDLENWKQQIGNIEDLSHNIGETRGSDDNENLEPAFGDVGSNGWGTRNENEKEQSADASHVTETLDDDTGNLKQQPSDLKAVWKTDNDILERETKNSVDKRNALEGKDDNLRESLAEAERDFWKTDKETFRQQMDVLHDDIKRLPVSSSSYADDEHSVARSMNPFQEDIFNLNMGEPLTNDYPSAEEHLEKEYWKAGESGDLNSGDPVKNSGGPSHPNTNQNQDTLPLTRSGTGHRGGLNSPSGKQMQSGSLKEEKLEWSNRKPYLPTRIRSWNDVNLQDLIYGSEPNEWEITTREERNSLDPINVGDLRSDSSYKRKRDRKIMGLRMENFLPGPLDMSDPKETEMSSTLHLQDGLTNYHYKQPNNKKKTSYAEDLLPKFGSFGHRGKSYHSTAASSSDARHLNAQAYLFRTDGPGMPVKTRANELNLQEFNFQNDDLNLGIPQKIQNDAYFLKLAEVGQAKPENPIEKKSGVKSDLLKLDDLLRGDPTLSSLKKPWKLPALGNVKQRDFDLISNAGIEQDPRKSSRNLHDSEQGEGNRNDMLLSTGEASGHHPSDLARRPLGDTGISAAEDAIHDADGFSLVQSLNPERELPLSLKLTRDLRDFWAKQKNDMEDKRDFWVDFGDLATGHNEKLANAINQKAKDVIRSANQPIIQRYDNPDDIDYEIDGIQREMESRYSSAGPNIPVELTEDKDMGTVDSLIHMGIDDPNPAVGDNLNSFLQTLRKPIPNADPSKVDNYVTSDKIFRQIQKAENYLNEEISKERKAEEAIILKEIKRQEEAEHEQRKKDENEMKLATKREGEAMKELEAVTKDLTKKKIKEYKKEMDEIKKALKEEQKDQELRRKEWQREMALLRKY